jgi:hypothetical protein
MVSKKNISSKRKRSYGGKNNIINDNLFTINSLSNPLLSPRPSLPPRPLKSFTINNGCYLCNTYKIANKYNLCKKCTDSILMTSKRTEDIGTLSKKEIINGLIEAGISKIFTASSIAGMDTFNGLLNNIKNSYDLNDLQKRYLSYKIDEFYTQFLNNLNTILNMNEYIEINL